MPSSKPAKPTGEKPPAAAKPPARKKVVDEKPAGKQPRSQKSETFEPGVEG